MRWVERQRRPNTTSGYSLEGVGSARRSTQPPSLRSALNMQVVQDTVGDRCQNDARRHDHDEARVEGVAGHEELAGARSVRDNPCSPLTSGHVQLERTAEPSGPPSWRNLSRWTPDRSTGSAFSGWTGPMPPRVMAALRKASIQLMFSK